MEWSQLVLGSGLRWLREEEDKTGEKRMLPRVDIKGKGLKHKYMPFVASSLTFLNPDVISNNGRLLWTTVGGQICENNACVFVF